MHKIELQITGKSYCCILPENWGDIGKKDWDFLARYILAGDVFFPELLHRLLQQKKNRFRRRLPKVAFRKIPATGLGEMYNCLTWLLQEPCTSPPVPHVKIKGKTYLFPADKLENISIVEFAFIDLAYEVARVYESQDNSKEAIVWLNRLAAYMLRPRDPESDPNLSSWDGDYRERFNTVRIEGRIKEFDKIPPLDRYACLIFFTGCKEYIHKRFPRLFPRTHTKDGKEIIGVDTSKKPDPKRWLKVISQLAGGKFGDYEQTKHTNLYVILEELQLQKEIRTEK